MKLDLNKLYNYIFGDWSDVDKHIKKDLPTEAREKAIKKRKQEINDFFAVHKNELRPFIRELKNSHLEKILFDNDTARVAPAYEYKQYLDEKFIQSKFEWLEARYSLLKEISSEEMLKMFTIYFEMARLIGEFFERTNNYGYASVFEHAYKMLVLFGADPTTSFIKIDKYLDKHNYSNASAKPLHDALIFELPFAGDDQIHLKKWQAIIQKEGPKAFQVFNMAPAIEKLLDGRCPNDLNEACDIAKNIKYRRAKEAPQLARVFSENNLNEKLFNYALEIDRPKKSRDNLPDTMIHGSAISKDYANYHLVKLPIGDPNAYVLGHLTNCCQSIGGNSQVCVIDGIRRVNNGFYVLLKKIKTAEKKGDVKSDASPIISGKIDYENFAIVGQGYAWLGRDGGLVFDSWENLTPLQDDKVIIPLLEKFSQVVTSAPDATILRVLIGTGGKTPSELTHITPCIEPMLEGTQYGDSTVQAVIYRNDTLIQSLLTNAIAYIKSALDDVVINAPVEVDKFIDWVKDSCVSKPHAMLLESSIQELTVAELQQIFFTKEAMELPFDACRFLVKAELFAVENINLLARHKDKSVEISKGFFTVIIAGFALDKVLFQIILQDVRPLDRAENIVLLYTELKKVNLDQYPEIRERALCQVAVQGLKPYIEALVLLRESKLLDDVSLRKAVASEFFNPPKLAKVIVDAYDKIRNAGFNVDPAISNAIVMFNDRGHFVDDIIRVLTLLKNAKFDLYPDVREVFLMSMYKSENGKHLEALVKLRSVGLDHEIEIRKAILNSENRNHKASADLIIEANTILDKDKMDPQLRIVILISYTPVVNAKIFVAQNVFYLEKMHIHYVLNSWQPDKALEFLLLLKEAKLDQDPDILENVCRSKLTESYTKDLIIAFKLLAEAKLDMNPVIKWQTIGCWEPLVKAKIFLLLQEAKLENDHEVLAVVNSSMANEKDANELINALKSLRAAKLDDHKRIWSRVMKCSNPAELANAFVELKSAQLDKDPDIMRVILSSDYRQASHIKAFIQAFAILKEINLHEDVDYKRIVLSGDNAVNEAKVILYLKKINLHNDIEIRNRLRLFTIGTSPIPEIIFALSLLDEEKLNTEQDKDIRSYVINHYDPVSSAEAFIALKLAKLKDEREILDLINYEKLSLPRILDLINTSKLLNNYDIKKDVKTQIMSNPDASKLAPFYVQLIEAGLENDTKLWDNIILRFGNNRSITGSFVDVFVELKKNNLDTNEKLRSFVFNISRISDMADLTDVIPLLHREKLVNDTDILDKILEHKEGQSLLWRMRDIVRGFVLLRKANLDQDVVVRKAMLTCLSFTAEKTANAIIEAENKKALAMTKVQEEKAQSAVQDEKSESKQVVSTDEVKPIEVLKFFINSLEDIFKKYSKVNLGFFTSFNLTARLECLSSFARLKDNIDNKDKDEIITQLLTILVKFQNDSVTGQSDPCLRDLQVFLQTYGMTLPEGLAASASLMEFKSKIARIELPKQDVSSAPR